LLKFALKDFRAVLNFERNDGIALIDGIKVPFIFFWHFGFHGVKKSVKNV